MRDDDNVLGFPSDDDQRARLYWYEQVKTSPDRWFRELRRVRELSRDKEAESMRLFGVLRGDHLPTWPEYQIGPPLRWDNGLDVAIMSSELCPPSVGLQWPIAHWMIPLRWWYRDNRTLVLTGPHPIEVDVERGDLLSSVYDLKDKTSVTSELLGELAIAWVAWEKWLRLKIDTEAFLPELGEIPNVDTGFKSDEPPH